jgi:hypothetical protein
MDRCEGCGFIYDLDRADGSGAVIVAGADEVADSLAPDRDEVRRRPDPSTWSALEYAAHLRDVLLVQRERVLAARRSECPTSPPMGRDERVEHDGYADQSADDVARQLRDAARLFANVLDRVARAGEWDRTLIYNYPAPSERSLRWVALHTEHEVSHHLDDVRGQLTSY